ncbi:hypothetical protein B0T26DRAFT_715986 [Lasiosphaeria miniovina]|uniref:Uncharacterized protein n=1 Tax=Lasiosphaeria miniovina TaxID=1954250 RepID=A0AA40AC84_9PEZI|nr:uncharacterized protein B0T26DRAFT_715986 [Lasiosphaeria miniovina]KAK0713023.1 hypothetical protein B0T26DRAFT_715986 [Lasiosphaeria miniovina]
MPRKRYPNRKVWTNSSHGALLSTVAPHCRARQGMLSHGQQIIIIQSPKTKAASVRQLLYVQHVACLEPRYREGRQLPTFQMVIIAKTDCQRHTGRRSSVVAWRRLQVAVSVSSAQRDRKRERGPVGIHMPACMWVSYSYVRAVLHAGAVACRGFVCVKNTTPTDQCHYLPELRLGKPNPTSALSFPFFFFSFRCPLSSFCLSHTAV